MTNLFLELDLLSEDALAKCTGLLELRFLAVEEELEEELALGGRGKGNQGKVGQRRKSGSETVGGAGHRSRWPLVGILQMPSCGVVNFIIEPESTNRLALFRKLVHTTFPSLLGMVETSTHGMPS